VADEIRLRACEKEIEKLKIEVTLLLSALKFEKGLPILGPGRFEEFANALKQAWAEAGL
jgi:hypothetical protein